MNLKDYAGKYYLWQNGLRVKVTGDTDKYEDWIMESPTTGRRWSVTPCVLEKAVPITEEQAKAQYVEISQGINFEGFCDCCAWKNGQEEMCLKLKLQQGQAPADECNRIQDALLGFLSKHNVKGVVPYVRSSEDGITFQFITRE